MGAFEDILHSDFDGFFEIVQDSRFGRKVSLFGIADAVKTVDLGGLRKMSGANAGFAGSVVDFGNGV